MQASAIFGVAVGYGGPTMPEQHQQVKRRRADLDGTPLSVALRVIAEHAYQLYVEGGCDRSRVEEYLRLAEEDWLES